MTTVRPESTKAPARQRPAPARRHLLIGLTLALGLAALSATPARAGFFLEGIPGASCAPANDFAETYWRREGRRLRNTGTRSHHVLAASCPISLVRPGWRPLEYRVYLTDGRRRDAFCRIYKSDGTLGHTEWTRWALSPVAPIWFRFDPPLESPRGWLEVTLRCLLHQGASLDRIVILWETP